MVKEFSTFGSCSSRNIFAESSNKGYKDFFKINFSLESVTLISLMSNPIEFDSNLLNSPKEYDNFCVENDFRKHKYLDFIKNSNLDYLVLDTYFDVLYSVIIIDENTFISASERLMHTDLGNSFKDYKRLSIYRDLIKFMKIWTAACDSFFEFINRNNDNLKIILNCSRPVYRYYSSENNEVIESLKLRSQVPITHSTLRDLLDTYILKNYDVHVLPFDNDTLANENHVWGLHPTHYEPKYYKEKTNQLNDIIEFDKYYNYSDKFYLKFRQLMRNNLCLQFEQNQLLTFQNQKNDEEYKLVSKYLTARIDIKNRGDEFNTIEILEISDKNALINFPQWFSDKYGKGLVIQSKQGRINLKIKCVNDGELVIRFLGIDFRDDLRNRLPIYIKFVDIVINGVKLNNKNEFVCHDNSFNFKKQVVNSEILTISASWSMI